MAARVFGMLLHHLPSESRDSVGAGRMEVEMRPELRGMQAIANTAMPAFIQGTEEKLSVQVLGGAGSLCSSLARLDPIQ